MLVFEVHGSVLLSKSGVDDLNKTKRDNPKNIISKLIRELREELPLRYALVVCRIYLPLMLSRFRKPIYYAIESVRKLSQLSIPGYCNGNAPF